MRSNLHRHCNPSMFEKWDEAEPVHDSQLCVKRFPKVGLPAVLLDKTQVLTEAVTRNNICCEQTVCSSNIERPAFPYIQDLVAETLYQIANSWFQPSDLSAGEVFGDGASSHAVHVMVDG